MEQDGGDGDTGFDRIDDAVVVLGVELMAAFDEDDAGAHPPGVGHDGTRLYAMGFCLVTGSDTAGCVGYTGTTPTGLPRSSGRSCCSTDAKYEFKSTNSQLT